jgi:hypothetical protein
MINKQTKRRSKPSSAVQVLPGQMDLFAQPKHPVERCCEGLRRMVNETTRELSHYECDRLFAHLYAVLDSMRKESTTSNRAPPNEGGAESGATRS